MKEITDPNEQKKIILNIMIEIDKFCRKNNIQYSLYYGTLLGAVRHNGFIPWDDDIDIIMTRDNYMKFINTFNINNITNYKLLSIYNSNDYFYTFSKVVDKRTCLIENGIIPIRDYGAYVDVFAVDKMPNNKIIRKLYSSYLYFLKKIGYAIRRNSTKKRGFKKIFVKFILKILKVINPNKHSRKIDKLSQKYDKKDVLYAGVIHSGRGIAGYAQPIEFTNLIELPFEGHNFLCVKEYNTFLTSEYGNYMQLPPKAERVTHHNFKLYWK